MFSMFVFVLTYIYTELLGLEVEVSPNIDSLEKLSDDIDANGPGIIGITHT